MDIRQILEGCKRNDARSQKALYGEFYGYALKIAFRYVYKYDLAVDITNDAFVKAFRNISTFRQEQTEHPNWLLKGWLKRIVINTAIDEIRKNKLKKEITGIPDWVWEEQNPADQADQRILYKELIGHLKALPSRYRTVFSLYVMDGYTHEEIAGMLGMAAGTSKSLLSRGRSLLQTMIREKHAYVLEGAALCS